MTRLTTNIVPPEGPIDADICWIGEAPGAEEDGQRRPFVGSAGGLLAQCWREVGIIRKEQLVTNCFKQRPPNNNVSYYFRDKSCTQPTEEGIEHIEALRSWLESLKALNGGPKLLVALGAVALTVLTGEKGISKKRGSVYPCTLVPGYKVYPMNHPSFVMRLIQDPSESWRMDDSGKGVDKKATENALPTFLIDLQRVLKESETREIRQRERKLLSELSYSEIIARLESILQEKPKLLAVDIETLPSETGPMVWKVGFSSEPDEAFSVPFIENLKLKWPLEEEARIWELISRIFLKDEIAKVFQNCPYDLTVLGKFFGLRVNRIALEDTMFCHHARYPFLRKGLDYLCSIYTTERYYKDEGKLHDGRRASDKAEGDYNCKDCCVTREILPIVRYHADREGYLEGYRRSMSQMPALLYMMLKGVRADREKKERLSEEFWKRANMAELKIKDLSEMKNLNLDSSDQIQKLLYGYLGLPIQFNRKSKKPTADRDALEKLRRKFPKIEILPLILEYRKFKILAKNFADMKLSADGRFYTSYSFVSTWRLNSSESHLGSGANLQNIPMRSEEGRILRELFLPDEGYLMGKADGSQAEARVVAWEAEDLEEIEFFLSGQDIHWKKTKAIFGFPQELEYGGKSAVFCDSITGEEHSHYTYRQLGKTIVHATNYGMGPGQLQTILAREGFIFELSVCRLFINRHHSSAPRVEEWKRGIREKINTSRTLISSYGRKRQFMGRLNEDTYRAAYAFSPQNTVGEWLTDSIQLTLDRELRAQPLLNVHDEMVFQFKPEDQEQVISSVRAIMERPLLIHGRELSIPAEISVGQNWGQMEKV